MTSETILWIKNILVSGKSGLSSKIKYRKVDSCCIQQIPGEGKRDGVPLCNSGTSIKQCLWNKVPRIKKNQLNSRYVTNRNNNNNKKKQKGTMIIFEALFNFWFTTMWQAGHVGGQYNINFSQRIFFLSEKLDSLW